MRRISVILLTLLLVGCVSQPAGAPTATSLPSTAAEAQAVLIQFFDRLNAKQYVEADVLYGGDYEQLQIFSPDAADHAGLWAGACERAGLQCLSVRTATFKTLQGDTYLFQVEFSNADGSLFVLGPCCGTDETEMPPVSLFEYRVTRNSAGRFRVMDLPPYTP
jgi:hypothetical protein